MEPPRASFDDTVAAFDRYSVSGEGCRVQVSSIQVSSIQVSSAVDCEPLHSVSSL